MDRLASTSGRHGILSLASQQIVDHAVALRHIRRVCDCEDGEIADDVLLILEL